MASSVVLVLMRLSSFIWTGTAHMIEADVLLPSDGSIFFLRPGQCEMERVRDSEGPAQRSHLRSLQLASYRSLTVHAHLCSLLILGKEPQKRVPGVPSL